MAMFVVVYFVFDKTVEVLSSLKVKQKENNLKIGEECEVSYETEEIADDGSTVIEEKNYVGKILWLCEAKKSATTIATKISNQLKEGLKIEDLIHENQQKFGKRDCGTKMKEAIDQLREDTVINKKGNKRSGQLPQVQDLSTAVSVKKQRTSKSKAEKKKSDTTTSSAPAEKIAISAEKIAEIGELLGANEIIKINHQKTPPQSPKSNIITPRKSPRLINNLPQKAITPIHSIQGKSTEQGKLATCSSATTSKMVTPKKSTPKKSTPKKLALPYEDFSPENRWDGMFTGSTRVLLDLDDQTSTTWHRSEDGLQNNSIDTTCSKSKEKICDLLGISETEAVVASKVFRKVADLLDGERTEDGNDDRDYLNSRESYTVDNSIQFQDDPADTADTSKQEEIAAVGVTPRKQYVNYHCQSNKWESVSTVTFNTTVTNKIGNARRKIIKSPKLSTI
ncbi:unnamed protein product [Mytilus coruscus]|uniref:Uncharacterized protein n=1 Tax=Mytilus coruscus TaxID=42192 RepID=A0A6J8BDX5_MYTCO|nr:unnamed protein product [Mytilus coruscus]